MKTSTSATIIICVLIAAATVLACTGHGDVVEAVIGAAILVVFFLFI